VHHTTSPANHGIALVEQQEYGFRVLCEEERKNPLVFSDETIDQRVWAFRKEIINWTPDDVFDDNYYKCDPRMRPTIPLDFKDEVEYFLTFDGYSLEGLRCDSCRHLELVGSSTAGASFYVTNFQVDPPSLFPSL